MSPTDSVARAAALLEARRPEQARALLRSHLATAVGDADALRLLAQAEFSLREYGACLEAARASLALDPMHAHAHRIAALALARVGKRRAAADEAARAISLAPHSWLGYLVRAQVDVTCRRVTRRSELAAREAVQLAPHEAQAHATLGSVLLARRRTRQAEASIRRALAIDPTSPVALNELGRAHLRRGRLGTAAAGFADAAARTPDPLSPASLNVLIAVYRIIRVVDVIALLAYLLVWHVSTGPSQLPSVVVMRVTWLAGAVLLCGVVLKLRRQVGAKARTTARVVYATNKRLVAWAVALGGGFLTLGVAAVAGSHAERGLLVVGTGLVVLAVILRLLAVAAVSRARRARKVPSRSL